MKPVLTAAEMRSCDERTIAERGVPSRTLMESAARGAVNALGAHVKIRGKKILVLCGKGNNGGDGMAAARMLRARGARVVAGLAAAAEELQGDARANYARAVKAGVRIVERVEPQAVVAGEWDVIVDALLGTGARLPLAPGAAALVEAANARRCFKFSFDIPTGIDADTGACATIAFCAQGTAAMGAYKRGLLIGEGRKHAGDVATVDIGIPEEFLRPDNYPVRSVERDDIAALLPNREIDANKYSAGSLFLLCGSRGMTGAAAMACNAAMRAGAGISILGVPESQQPVMAAKLTETMTVCLPETEERSINDPALQTLMKYSVWGDAFVVGCGISKNERTAETARNFLRALRAPSVLDADGIAAFRGRLDELRSLETPLVLTPHYGELAKLIEIDRAAIERDPIETALNTATRLHCVLALKGAPTVVASPDGVCYVNTTGNAGMATAGTGDVLAGIIGALLAQGLPPLNAAIAGVFLHGRAGDRAAERYTQRGMIATDVIACLPEALAELGAGGKITPR